MPQRNTDLQDVRGFSGRTAARDFSPSTSFVKTLKASLSVVMESSRAYFRTYKSFFGRYSVIFLVELIGKRRLPYGGGVSHVSVCMIWQHLVVRRQTAG